MFEKNLLGQRIYKLRLEKNITQQNLAEILNLKKQTISMIENGQRATSLEVIYDIAKHLNVSVDYLLGLTDEPNPPK